MTRSLIAAALVSLTGCASTPPPPPPTPAQMLLGAWNCETTSSGITIKSAITYVAGGKGSFHINVAGGQGGFGIDASGDGEQTWALSENDTKLASTITSVKITTAKLNGQDIEASMAQGMIEPMLKGQSSTATIAITPTMLVETTPEATTNCKR